MPHACWTLYLCNSRAKLYTAKENTVLMNSVSLAILWGTVLNHFTSPPHPIRLPVEPSHPNLLPCLDSAQTSCLLAFFSSVSNKNVFLFYLPIHTLPTLPSPSLAKECVFVCSLISQPNLITRRVIYPHPVPPLYPRTHFSMFVSLNWLICSYR